MSNLEFFFLFFNAQDWRIGTKTPTNLPQEALLCPFYSPHK